jgi:hypothetical protein
VPGFARLFLGRAGDQSRRLRLLAGRLVGMDRFGRRGSVETANEVAVRRDSGVLVTLGDGSFEAPVERFRGRAIVQILEPLPGSDRDAPLLLLDVGHTVKKAPLGRPES